MLHFLHVSRPEEQESHKNICTCQRKLSKHRTLSMIDTASTFFGPQPFDTSSYQTMRDYKTLPGQMKILTTRICFLDWI